MFGYTDVPFIIVIQLHNSIPSAITLLFQEIFTSPPPVYLLPCETKSNVILCRHRFSHSLFLIRISRLLFFYWFCGIVFSLHTFFTNICNTFRYICGSLLFRGLHLLLSRFHTHIIRPNL